MKRWILYLPLFLISCTNGKGVKYDEMFTKPKLAWDRQGLIVRTENSKENSALLIYDIQSTVDIEKNLILLSGYQAACRDYKTEFTILFPNRAMRNFKVFWIDPDGSRIPLSVDSLRTRGE
jgi:hypothetical protein